jgi:tetratricopeptide (TPR) repeat protein
MEDEVTLEAGEPGTHFSDSDTSLAPPPPPADGRYQFLGALARGGMGVVYRATDTRLGREVAVKVLLDRFNTASGTARRFVDEARVTGQLQHPGIPAVYDLGHLPDGRPFLAMKLVKGTTLEQRLASRPAPSADRGQFLAVFEQICQAVGYAHDHQVVHRDLKPANVMVGAFGEVQVMDWGLAKVLTPFSGEPEATAPEATEPPGTEIRTLRGPDGAHTQSGSVLGTPSFMPPEQAAGLVGKVDARSDVFGLGAILAAILTGQPPYVGPDGEAVWLMAVQGELADCLARLGACGAEQGLVDLCRRCLSPKPEGRPGNAGAVAREVARLRAAAEQRARAAELEQAKTQAEAREQRKRRRVQLALAAAVGLLLLGGGTGAWWRYEQARRDRESVSALLDRCEEALAAGNTANAAVAFEAAERRSAEGGANPHAGRVELRRADLTALRDLDEIDQLRWTKETKFDDRKEVAARTRTALGQFGVHPGQTPVDVAGARVRESAVRDQLVAALDRLLWAEKSADIRAVLRAVDPDGCRDPIRDAVLAGDAARVKELARRAEALAQPPGFMAVLGEDETIDVGQRRTLLAAALRRHPGELGLLMTMGITYHDPDRSRWADERARWFQAAVSAHPDSPTAHTNLGTALRDKEDLDGAVAEHQKAIRLGPSNAFLHNNLGIALQDKGDLSGAVAEFKEAIRLEPLDGTPHNNLGVALKVMGDLDGAVTEYREAARLAPKKASPHTNLGNALRDRGDLDRAVAEYREAIHLDPTDGAPHTNLGNILKDRGDLGGAITEYREAIRLDPRHALLHSNLGVALKANGDLGGAITEYREAIRLDPRHAIPHSNLGITLQAKGDLDGAIAAYREALRIDPKQPDSVARLPGAERMRELLRRLPDVLAGRAEPKGPAEAIGFAELCGQPFQERFASAVRLYETAFAADLALAENLAAAHRYDATCFAARAARGDGIDAPAEPAARVALRAKALTWLRADLAATQKKASPGDAAGRKFAVDNLSHWLEDSDLVGVRDAAPLAALPDDERKEWLALWDAVRAERDKARRPGNTNSPPAP